MSYNPNEAWSKEHTLTDFPYPSEYVIRIFRGAYPRLNFDKKSFLSKKVCDIGCGGGRNIPLLVKCGFEVYALEIAERIVEQIKSHMLTLNLPAHVAVGTNSNIPFANDFFDFLLSWNVCYYMGESEDFGKHVEEYARVLKSGGYLVMSLPKKTGFIYKDSIPVRPGYRLIQNDPFGVRNGEVLRIFESQDEIEETFSCFFKDFIFASIEDDCFGYDYHFHLVICQKI